jgi:hypothetical protein
MPQAAEVAAALGSEPAVPGTAWVAPMVDSVVLRRDCVPLERDYVALAWQKVQSYPRLKTWSA